MSYDYFKNKARYWFGCLHGNVINTPEELRALEEFLQEFIATKEVSPEQKYDILIGKAKLFVSGDDCGYRTFGYSIAKYNPLYADRDPAQGYPVLQLFQLIGQLHKEGISVEKLDELMREGEVSILHIIGPEYWGSDMAGSNLYKALTKYDVPAKLLAWYKRTVCRHICNIPDLEERKAILKQALNPNDTNLGQFFWLQRGAKKPRLEKGRLKHISIQLAKLEPSADTFEKVIQYANSGIISMQGEELGNFLKQFVDNKELSPKKKIDLLGHMSYLISREFNTGWPQRPDYINFCRTLCADLDKESAKKVYDALKPYLYPERGIYGNPDSYIDVNGIGRSPDVSFIRECLWLFDAMHKQGVSVDKIHEMMRKSYISFEDYLSNNITEVYSLIKEGYSPALLADRKEAVRDYVFKVPAVREALEPGGQLNEFFKYQRGVIGKPNIYSGILGQICEKFKILYPNDPIPGVPVHDGASASVLTKWMAKFQSPKVPQSQENVGSEKPEQDNVDRPYQKL